jgi:hypothetical protein
LGITVSFEGNYVIETDSPVSARLGVWKLVPVKEFDDIWPRNIKKLGRLPRGQIAVRCYNGHGLPPSERSDSFLNKGE